MRNRFDARVFYALAYVYATEPLFHGLCRNLCRIDRQRGDQ